MLGSPSPHLLHSDIDLRSGKGIVVHAKLHGADLSVTMFSLDCQVHDRGTVDPDPPSWLTPTISPLCFRRVRFSLTFVCEVNPGVYARRCLVHMARNNLTFRRQGVFPDRSIFRPIGVHNFRSRCYHASAESVGSRNRVSERNSVSWVPPPSAWRRSNARGCGASGRLFAYFRPLVLDEQ